MQCSAQHQAVRHHTISTDGAARHAGCSGPTRPCVTARRRRQGSVGQVRECTGPAMPQHTYTQRAHNTHSPARLPVPVGRHPGLLPFGNSAFGTPHHTTLRLTDCGPNVCNATNNRCYPWSFQQRLQSVKKLRCGCDDRPSGHGPSSLSIDRENGEAPPWIPHAEWRRHSVFLP